MTDKMRKFAEELADLLEKHDAQLLAFGCAVSLSIGDEDLEVFEITNEVDIRGKISSD